MSGAIRRRALCTLVGGSVLSAVSQRSFGVPQRGVMLGVHTESLPDRSLGAVVDALIAWEVKTCALWSGHVPPGRAESVRRALHGAGVGICTYSAVLDARAPDEAIEQAFLTAQALEAGWLTVACDGRALARLARVAKRRGREVAVRLPARQLTKAISGPGRELLGVVVDLGDFAAGNLDVIAFLETHHARTLTVEIPTSAVENERRVGAIEGALRLLFDRGWDIPAIIRHDGKRENALSEVTRCVKLCRRVLAPV